MSGHAYVVVILWTTLAVGVGVHATNRDRSGFLWGFVTFLTGLLGVLVYALVVTSDSPGAGADDGTTHRVCPECGARHDGSPDYCSDCGEPLGEDADTGAARILRSGSDGYCSNCHSRVDLDADRCADCGYVF